MSMNGISAYTNTMMQANELKASKKNAKESASTTENSTTNIGFSEEAAVYEPSGQTPDLSAMTQAAEATETSEVSSAYVADAETTEAVASENKESAATDRSAIIEQLKADAESAKESLINMVREALGQQAGTYGLSIGEDDIWKKLASGEVTVSEEARAEAEEAISEDGYWGVDQTSDRILEFAKALAGDDVSKADELLEAFKEGYSQATSSWGQDLPDISQQTYDAVLEKFQNWKDSEEQGLTE